LRQRCAAWSLLLTAAFCWSLPVPRAIAAASAPEQRAVPANPHGPTIGECGLCHLPEAWAPAVISRKFDHGRLGFPLEGAHGRTPCRACHVSLRFSEEKPKSDCVDCHQDVHQGELGSSCGRCHTARTFIDRNRMGRAHQSTRFPLMGAHLTADCEACHQQAPQGQLTYVNRPGQCADCHMSQYQGTVSPFHQVVGFSTDCVQCHTPLAWSAGRYLQHDMFFFPIYSGTHRRKWDGCSDCHTNPLDHGEFSCFTACHAHADPASVAGDHQGVSGFVYDSPYCYSCHPDGRRP
jgi:Zn finger protein HypA/HybF involved in hydrogenase expression